MMYFFEIGILTRVDIFQVNTSFNSEHYSYMKNLELSYEKDFSTTV